MKAKILVVDDDEEILELITTLLKDAQFNVIAAMDAVKTYSLLRSNAVDLAILDIKLPGEDGISLCENIRKKYTLPIIMLTASTEKIDLLLSLNMGADLYLTKPFDDKYCSATLKPRLEEINRMILFQGKNIVYQKALFMNFQIGNWTQTRAIYLI